VLSCCQSTPFDPSPFVSSTLAIDLFRWRLCHCAADTAMTGRGAFLSFANFVQMANFGQGTEGSNLSCSFLLIVVEGKTGDWFALG
jgi:hypothetical protein